MLTNFEPIIYVVAPANKNDIWQIISTIVSIIALFIAIKALYVWKDEIREKRKYELTKKLYFFVEEFETYYHKYIIDNVQIDLNEVNIYLKKFNMNLHEILFEYTYIVQNSKIKEILLYLKKLTNIKDDDSIILRLDETNKDLNYINSEDYINKKSVKKITKCINILKQYCKQEIKKFYIKNYNDYKLNPKALYIDKKGNYIIIKKDFKKNINNK